MELNNLPLLNYLAELSCRSKIRELHMVSIIACPIGFVEVHVWTPESLTKRKLVPVVSEN